MKRSKNSKNIVVDTSVARASGGENATHPVPKVCRDTLQTILKVCHHIVMTEPIKAEWKRHQSDFARKWLVQMKARRKYAQPLVNENLILRSKLTAKVNEKDSETILKDCMLLEAALATDKVIISLDNTVREKFALACEGTGEIREIVWVNPIENLQEWLEDGAEHHPSKLLRNYLETD